MGARGKTGRERGTKNMLIILITIIVAGIGIVLLLNLISGTGNTALQEGQDYELKHVTGSNYQVIDDEGNVVELRRVTPELYKDSRGRSYRFVSGSPYKYMGNK